MLTSDDVPLNIDDLCSTMGADSAPSNFGSGFLLPDRLACPITADRLERRDTAGMRWSTGGREPPALPRMSRRLKMPGGSSCSFRVRIRRSHTRGVAGHDPSSLCLAQCVARGSWSCASPVKELDLCSTLLIQITSDNACLRPQLGRRLIAETPPLPDVPDGPFLMKQEALPSMTGMIPVPLQDRVGVPASSDGELRQSGSSSQGARGGPDPSPNPIPRPDLTWMPQLWLAPPRASDPQAMIPDVMQTLQSSLPFVFGCTCGAVPKRSVMSRTDPEETCAPLQGEKLRDIPSA